jgi:NTE family protein
MTHERANPKNAGQIVLVLQGGGAHGAYHAGVYEALHEAGFEPDWIIGTSIGAVNGALIAGNAPDKRLDRLVEFWRRMSQNQVFDLAASLPLIGRRLPSWLALMSGVDDFFAPNPLGFLGPQARIPIDRAGLYSTRPLERPLAEMVDFSRIGQSSPRLTVGAAHIKNGGMRYFDSRDTNLTIKHILASGAMPPAFTPISIEDEYYWDGGLLSNTPVETIFDDHPRRSSLVFSVQVWHPEGPLPESIWEVFIRSKEILFSSATSSHIKRQKQIHRLRHVIADLATKLPPEERAKDEVRDMLGYGCLTQMHIVRLLAPRDTSEDHMGEIDFSSANIRERWKAGYKEARRIIEKAPWERQDDPREGVYLHEFHEEHVEPR